MFRKFPEIKRQLWEEKFWSDGYYIGTTIGRGDINIIENYIKNQDREEDFRQLKLFDL